MTTCWVSANIQIALQTMTRKDYIWKKDQDMNFYLISLEDMDLLLLRFCFEINLNDKCYFWTWNMSKKMLG